MCRARRRQRGQRPCHRRANRPHQDSTPGEKNAFAVMIRHVLTLCSSQLFSAYRVNMAHYPPKKEKKKSGNVSAFIRGGKNHRRSGINSRFVAVFFFTRRCAKSAAHLRLFFLFSASTRGFMRRS